MTDDPFERAVRHEHEADRRRAYAGFKIHLVVYIAVQLLLVTTWFLTSDGGRGFPWFWFPLLGWGIGLAAHFAAIHFGFGGDTDGSTVRSESAPPNQNS